MGTRNCSVTLILQNIFFCVQLKKVTHTGLEGWVNDDRIFIFEWTIPLMSNYPVNVQAASRLQIMFLYICALAKVQGFIGVSAV